MRPFELGISLRLSAPAPGLFCVILLRDVKGESERTGARGSSTLSSRIVITGAGDVGGDGTGACLVNRPNFSTCVMLAGYSSRVTIIEDMGEDWSLMRPFGIGISLCRCTPVIGSRTGAGGNSISSSLIVIHGAGDMGADGECTGPLSNPVFSACIMLSGISSCVPLTGDMD